ncbi:hypothetical protein J6590_058742 [Homalodisca vitripennis]|nr:hypothetical protein J6590_058742 [Homalodisca vitripennis]
MDRTTLHNDRRTAPNDNSISESDGLFDGGQQAITGRTNTIRRLGLGAQQQPTRRLIQRTPSEAVAREINFDSEKTIKCDRVVGGKITGLNLFEPKASRSKDKRSDCRRQRVALSSDILTCRYVVEFLQFTVAAICCKLCCMFQVRYTVSICKTVAISHTASLNETRRHDAQRRDAQQMWRSRGAADCHLIVISYQRGVQCWGGGALHTDINKLPTYCNVSPFHLAKGSILLRKADAIEQGEEGE